MLRSVSCCTTWSSSLISSLMSNCNLKVKPHQTQTFYADLIISKYGSGTILFETEHLLASSDHLTGSLGFLGKPSLKTLILLALVCYLISLKFKMLQYAIQKLKQKI